MIRRAIVCALICTLGSSASGCAALMMRSPHTTEPAVPPRCSDGRGGVILDGLFTAVYGLIGLAVLSEGESGASLPFLALRAH